MALDGVPAPDRLVAPQPPQPPRQRVALVIGALCVLAVVVSAWLATRPGAQEAQAAAVVWLNHPPQPLAALFAVVNPLLRPLPLTVLAIALAAWVLLRIHGTLRRLECARALVLSLVVAEVIAQILKRLLDQPRPTAVIPGLDVHGYPQDPWGRAFPSAHTALTVAAVSALWPWMNWWQRAVGLAMVVLVPLNRVYIAAHWPIDLIGGAAVGLLAASACWLVADRWPIERGQGGDLPV